MNTRPKTLDCIRDGESAKVLTLGTNSALRERLLALGLTAGTMVECVRAGNGIAAYRIRGAVIALRDVDARSIEIIPETAAALL